MDQVGSPTPGLHPRDDREVERLAMSLTSRRRGVSRAVSDALRGTVDIRL